MKLKILHYCLSIFISLGTISTTTAGEPGTFSLARIHYRGGGDWYANPSSIPNLMKFVGKHTTIKTVQSEVRVKISDEELFRYPILYMTGHGNVSFTNTEALRLREYLTSGGIFICR